MKPEYNIYYEDSRAYQGFVSEVQTNKKYIKLSLSVDDIGHLLQEKHITLSFVNDADVIEGMIVIEMADSYTKYEVSEELNNLIVNTKL